MVKILSRAGVTLADVYDVEGSIAGVEQLHSEEVALVHEMGATIFSERLASAVRRGGSTDAQNTTFTVQLTDLPTGISRVLNLCVFVDTAARVDRVQVSIRSDSDGREVPLFVWNTASDDEVQMRLQDNGQAVAEMFLLRPAVMLNNLPALLINQNQPPRRVAQIVMRGDTSGFGAGTVSTVMVLQVAHTQVASAGVSSLGLPVPGW